MLHKIITYIEQAIIWGILIVISVMLALTFIDIVFDIREQIMISNSLFISANGLMELFSSFLVILIGLELVETIKIYLHEDVVHVEIIILVAIIAISRKVIVWDFKTYSYIELLSVAGTIVALGLTYYLIKKADLTIKINKGGKSEKEDK